MGRMRILNKAERTLLFAGLPVNSNARMSAWMDNYMEALREMDEEFIICRKQILDNGKIGET